MRLSLFFSPSGHSLCSELWFRAHQVARSLCLCRTAWGVLEGASHIFCQLQLRRSKVAKSEAPRVSWQTYFPPARRLSCFLDCLFGFQVFSFSDSRSRSRSRSQSVILRGHACRWSLPDIVIRNQKLCFLIRNSESVWPTSFSRFYEFVELSTFQFHLHRDERHILQSVIQTFCCYNSEFLTLGDDQFDVVRSDILWTIASRLVGAVLRTLLTGTRLVWSSHKRSFLLWGSLFACSMKSL